MKKSGNTRAKFYAPLLIVALVMAWQLFSLLEIVPKFLLPSPLDVAAAFVKDLPLLLKNLWITLWEATLGLGLGIVVGFVFALLMDRFDGLKQALYPVLVLTQTVPTVAIAPLLVLWMGYGIAPKVVLIFIVTFFPITTNLLEGFRCADADEIRLLQAMGASEKEIFKYIKWPSSLTAFFSSLKIAASYAIVGAVIAEWLGGNQGLGVYMTRVKASYSYDKMFAVIFLISILSLALLSLVGYLKKIAMPWDREEIEE